MSLQYYLRRNKKRLIALIGDRGIGKHQLIENMLDVETKVNDKDILSMDFFVSYIWTGDGLYQTIHYWVISLDQNQQLKRLPFVPQCDIYVIMFSLNETKSLLDALYTWFELCSQKRKAQYIFLGQENGGERKCGSYQDIVKTINNKMIRSTPNLEDIKHESVNMRKTIAYTEEFTEEQLPENVEYLEIQGNDHNPFKRLLIQQIQSSISQERQKLYSISAPISPNFVPQLQKSVSQFVQKTDYSRSSFLTVSELQMEPEKNIEQVVKTIPIECEKPPPRTSMAPKGFSLEQSGYQEQKKEAFCCQLI